MNLNLPKTLIRISDGEEFVLNENTRKYSMKILENRGVYVW
jgi:hypothetical protein